MEEKVLKQKEVEVVFNDEEMFKNADKLPGMNLSSSSLLGVDNAET